MFTSQKHLFQLPDDIVFLNGAYMSPLLQSVEEAGFRGLIKKRNPAAILSEDFFTLAEEVRHKAATIINAPAHQIALLPSSSYGLKSVINNLPTNNGNHAITVADEFPSGYYTIANWCKQHHKALVIIQPPESKKERGKNWNTMLLEAISADTSVVLLSSVHWTDGTKFDLEKIGQRCKEVNALLVIDGTQSVGALPIDVAAYPIDALVCAGYKWLLGPYSIGFAYMSERFNDGQPLEDTWMNKLNANDFTSLTNYTEEYMPGAMRYDVGEFSNFILLPMLHQALSQIIKWNIQEIQAYSRQLSTPLVRLLMEKDFWVEEDDYRAGHLFGFLLPSAIQSAPLLKKLRDKKIFVSQRGHAIRVSTHVYNTASDVAALQEIIAKI